MSKKNYVIDALACVVVSTLAAQIASSAFCANAESDKNKQKHERTVEDYEKELKANQESLGFFRNKTKKELLETCTKVIQSRKAVAYDLTSYEDVFRNIKEKYAKNSKTITKEELLKDCEYLSAFVADDIHYRTSDQKYIVFLLNELKRQYKLADFDLEEKVRYSQEKVELAKKIREFKYQLDLIKSSKK